MVAGLQATGNWVLKAGQSKYCECMSFLFELDPFKTSSIQSKWQQCWQSAIFGRGDRVYRDNVFSLTIVILTEREL